MTTHSPAGPSAVNSNTQTRDDSNDDNSESSSLKPQLEALADIWEALQSLPEQETSPIEYLESAETRSRLESQLHTRLKRLGADVLEQFLDARQSDDSTASNFELLADLNSAPEKTAKNNTDLDEVVPDLHSAVTDAPEKLVNTADLQAELDSLHALLDTDRLEAYASLPDELHRAMLTVVVARMRRLQTYRDRPAADALALDDAVSELFRTLGRHLNRYDPGYIRGMKLDHDPYTDSWVDDVNHWSNRLSELCNDYLTTPLGQSPTEPDNQANSAEELDARQALNSIEESIADDGTDRDDLRDLVAAYLDQGLSAAHPRLIDMLAPHSELFTADRFQPLQHAFSER